jgi:hypothetical protein
MDLDCEFGSEFSGTADMMTLSAGSENSGGRGRENHLGPETPEVNAFPGAGGQTPRVLRQH